MSDNGTETAVREARTVIRAEEEARSIACAKKVDAALEEFNCQLTVQLGAPLQRTDRGGFELLPVPVVVANPLQIPQEETKDQKRDS